MSGRASAWARGQTVGDATAKAVLREYAHWAAEDYTAWVSNQTLMAALELDIKTIRKCRDRLVKLGFLVETGRRGGSTGNVVVYQMTAPLGSRAIAMKNRQTGEDELVSPPMLEDCGERGDQRRPPSENIAPRLLASRDTKNAFQRVRDSGPLLIEVGLRNESRSKGPTHEPVDNLPSPSKIGAPKGYQKRTPSESEGGPLLPSRGTKNALQGVPNLDPDLIGIGIPNKSSSTRTREAVDNFAKKSLLLPSKEKPDKPGVASAGDRPSVDDRPPGVGAFAMLAVLLELEADRGKGGAITLVKDCVHLDAWAARGTTIDQLREAYRRAVAARERDHDGRPINSGFLARFVDEVMATAGNAAGGGRPWYASADAAVVDAKGAKFGVRPRKPDESIGSYRVLVVKASRENSAIDFVLNDAKKFNDEALYRFAVTQFGDALLSTDLCAA